MQKLLTKGIGYAQFKETAIGKVPQDWDTVEFGPEPVLAWYGISPSP